MWDTRGCGAVASPGDRCRCSFVPGMAQERGCVRNMREHPPVRSLTYTVCLLLPLRSPLPAGNSCSWGGGPWVRPGSNLCRLLVSVFSSLHLRRLCAALLPFRESDIIIPRYSGNLSQSGTSHVCFSLMANLLVALLSFSFQGPSTSLRTLGISSTTSQGCYPDATRHLTPLPTRGAHPQKFLPLSFSFPFFDVESPPRLLRPHRCCCRIST